MALKTFYKVSVFDVAGGVIILVLAMMYKRWLNDARRIALISGIYG